MPGLKAQGFPEERCGVAGVGELEQLDRRAVSRGLGRVGRGEGTEHRA